MTKAAVNCRILLFFVLVVIAACGGGGKPQKYQMPKPSFKKVWGIKYTEVKRRLANGLSFDSYGFQQEPQWQLSFPVDDSALVYSPERDKFYYFPVTYDHDSVINMARTWLRVKKVERDSLVFEVLKVQGMKIHFDVAKLYMTFYANDYIEKKLHTTVAALRRPSAADTAFIAKMANYVNTHPDTAFAARQPVELIPRSNNITVENISGTTTDTAKFSLAKKNNDEYFNPEYNITIRKAYADFNYSFYVYVSATGDMRLGGLLIAPGDFEEQKRKTITAILNGYLKAYLTVIPGSTLGIPHTSTVVFNLKGISG